MFLPESPYMIGRGVVQYDLQLAGETLQLTRKTGEQIASIPLVSSVAASFQGFTEEDRSRFDKLEAILRSEHLQQSQQRQQGYGTELD